MSKLNNSFENKEAQKGLALLSRNFFDKVENYVYIYEKPKFKL